MSFLYPRLLAAQARPLYEEYQHLSPIELTGRVATVHNSAVYVATGGDRVSSDQLMELRAAVVDLARSAGFPYESDRARNAEFDLRIAALLHHRTGMVPAEAASRDVWAFLALVLLPDVAYWRYPNPPKDRVLATDLTRHVFGRLWWRAQLVRSPDSTDPYGALNILGEAAFDQIYARRAALGGSPHTVRAILRVWDELDLTGLREREALQDFLKRLLRLAPFVLFDGVEERQLDEEIRAVAQESLDAQRRALSPAGEPGPEPRQDTSIVSTPAAGPLSTSWSVEDAVQLLRSPEPPGTPRFSSVEICAGCGAQALGLERAGFDPVLLIDSKADACFTIDLNRPDWEVVCMDVLQFRPDMRPEALGVDLLSGGLPRLAAVAAGRTEDTEEHRVLMAAVELACSMKPRALLLENLPDLVESPQFAPDRAIIEARLGEAGYRVWWRVLNAVDFGVPQGRKSGFVVALQDPWSRSFCWPEPDSLPAPTVGEVLGPSMSSQGWPGAQRWAKNADRVAPPLVGGSDRRGGADLGPTGSKRAWAALGVNGISLGDTPPDAHFPVDGVPRLTVEQAAMIQMIPEDWRFFGGKTSRYRQIGHAMPPPLATAVGQALASALAG